MLCFLVTPVLRFPVLPYYPRNVIRFGRNDERYEHPSEKSYKFSVLKNIPKLTGKHLCPAQLFSCEFCDIFNTYFVEHMLMAASVLSKNIAEDYSLHTYHFTLRCFSTTAQTLANKFWSFKKSIPCKSLWINLFRF